VGVGRGQDRDGRELRTGGAGIERARGEALEGVAKRRAGQIGSSDAKQRFRRRVHIQNAAIAIHKQRSLGKLGGEYP
jgi:hypothetical protein